MDPHSVIVPTGIIRNILGCSYYPIILLLQGGGVLVLQSLGLRDWGLHISKPGPDLSGMGPKKLINGVSKAEGSLLASPDYKSYFRSG